MRPKYKTISLTNGWAVVMAANDYIVHTCDTEEDAARAMMEFEGGQRFVEKKRDVWVIGETFVSEPELGGVLVGEVSQFDMNQFNVAIPKETTT